MTEDQGRDKDKEIPEIDWSDFDGDPQMTCYCRCEEVFRSHCKNFYTTPPHCTVTRDPCPGCEKRTNCYRISSDPETFTIQEGSTGVTFSIGALGGIEVTCNCGQLLSYPSSSYPESITNKTPTLSLRCSKCRTKYKLSVSLITK